MKPVKNHYYIYVNRELEIVCCDYEDFVETFAELKTIHGDLVTYEILEPKDVICNESINTLRDVMDEFFDTFYKE